MNYEEMTTYAAIEIMGWKYSEEPPVSSTIQKGKLKAGKEFASYSWPLNPNGNIAERFLCDSMKASDWLPLKNENHLSMIRDKLVEMGFDIHSRHNDGGFSIKIYRYSRNKPYTPIVDVFSYEESINETHLKAYCDAHRKLNE